MAPVVSTQSVPVEALTIRMAKPALLSTPERPLKSAVTWLFQPLANWRKVPLTVLALVVLVAMTPAAARELGPLRADGSVR